MRCNIDRVNPRIKLLKDPLGKANDMRVYGTMSFIVQFSLLSHLEIRIEAISGTILGELLMCEMTPT
jgi:hypothetical protein